MPTRRRAGPARSFTASREHFLTQDGKPRKPAAVTYEGRVRSVDGGTAQRHRDRRRPARAAHRARHAAYRRDLNVLVSRGVWRMFAIAEAEYRRTLDAHAVLDFPDVLLRALELLRQMEEFSQSRYPARVALPPRARRRVPGHEPRAVGAGVAADPVVGRGRRPAPTASRRSSSSATGSSRSTASATRTSRCCARPARYIEALRPDGDVRSDRSRGASARCRRCSRSSTTCSPRCAAGRAAGRLHLHGGDRFPV